MPVSFRRLSAVVLAVCLMGAVAVEEAVAQGAPVGPAGGIGSTTAPSNGEGTPSGGSGNVQTTRVGPSTNATTARSTRRRAPRRTTRQARPAAARSN